MYLGAGGAVPPLPSHPQVPPKPKLSRPSPGPLVLFIREAFLAGFLVSVEYNLFIAKPSEQKISHAVHT